MELGGDEVPPVPAVPAVFARGVAGGAGESQEVKKASDVTVADPVRRAAPDRTQETINTSFGSSLVHVEHALDVSREYSIISATSAARDERRHSGKLPWRRSVQGAFEDGKTVDGLPLESMREKRPSGMFD